MKNKLKIALTGGIGTGKSKVAEIIESFGYLVIKADDISKSFLFNDVDIQHKLIDEFGSDVFANGEINKQFLIEEVFKSEANTQKVNSILHPPTIDKINDLMKVELDNKNLVFVEAALIFEAKMESMFDEIILVTSNMDLRFNRINQRDGKSELETQRIIDKQMSDEAKKLKSAIFIENNNTLDYLENEVKNIITSLEERTNL